MRIPRWIKNEIDAPLAMGEGRNNQMIKVGPSLIRLGMDPEELFDLFCGMYPDIDDNQRHEIQAVVCNAIKLASREDKAIDKEEYARRKVELDQIARAERHRLQKILEDYQWTEQEIREATRISERLPLLNQRWEFLRALFQPQDIVWIGMVWETGDRKSRRGKVIGNYGNRFRTRDEWIHSRSIPGEFCSHCTFKPGTTSRCNDAVYDHKYLVVESDTLSRDEVGAVFNWLTHCGLELYAIVSSGGRSLHGWFDWPGAERIDEWAAALTGLQCDVATLRPSQPVRLPGTLRKSTGKLQELLYLR